MRTYSCAKGKHDLCPGKVQRNFTTPGQTFEEACLCWCHAYANSQQRMLEWEQQNEKRTDHA